MVHNYIFPIKIHLSSIDRIIFVNFCIKIMSDNAQMSDVINILCEYGARWNPLSRLKICHSVSSIWNLSDGFDDCMPLETKV